MSSSTNPEKKDDNTQDHEDRFTTPPTEKSEGKRKHLLKVSREVIRKRYGQGTSNLKKHLDTYMQYKAWDGPRKASLKSWIASIGRIVSLTTDIWEA
ncbi:unnamed protein product [Cochlearia groenlandica]